MSNETKRIIGYCLFLAAFLIMLYYLARLRFEAALTVLLLQVIISFILMIIPTIFRLVCKKRMEYKKGSIVCMLNSLILYIVSSIPFVLTLLKDKEIDIAVSFNPISFSKEMLTLFGILAIIYYFINKCFFVDSKK